MNKYEILGTIGEGEYGVVRKARNRETDQLVAIKKFKDDTDEENKKVILREVKVMKMMRHENITQFKEAYRKKGKVYLICEFVERNLLQIMEQVRCLEGDRVKYLMWQLLKGLEYMHSLDLIHRDLKPENLLINSDDSLKICDFGFTRVVSNNGKMTDYVATRWYRAPELLLGREDYDKSVDIWAAGCILAEMIDSQPLFPGESEVDQLYLMQRSLGPLTPQHQQFFLKHPKFVGVKFPELNTMETLDRRYLGKIDKQGLDLMKRMLKMNPRERITAAQALKRPYFARMSVVDRISTTTGTSTKKSTVMDSSTTAGYHQQQLSHQSRYINMRERDETRTRELMTPIPLTFDRHQQKTLLNSNKVTGINKIKGISTNQTPATNEQNPAIFTTKSKIMQNLQKVGAKLEQDKSTIGPTNQPTKLIKKQQFQYILHKKTKSPEQARNYIPDFEEEEEDFPQVPQPRMKSRQNHRKKYIEEEEIAPPEESAKTPTLTKMLKKKLSKYNATKHQPLQKNNFLADEAEEEYANPGRQNQPAYNIIFNNNTFNYNYRK